MIYFLFFLLAFRLSAQAQCTVPTASAETITNQICPGTGSINVTSVAGGSGVYQYALYDQANTTAIKPYQDASLIANVTGNNTIYTLRIRSVCSNPAGFSDEFTKQITVGGIYTQPTISTITVNRKAQCNDGQITVGASPGISPLQYALVNSLNDPEPVGTYVRPKQSSNIFTGLAAGTYYARVYDACNSFATQSVTVGSFTATNPFQGFYLTYLPCDQLKGTLTYTQFGFQNNPLNQFTVTYPDGSTAPLNTPNANTNSFDFSIPIARLGTGSGTFPDNAGAWPKTFMFTFKDACDNLYTFNKTFQKPCSPALVLTGTNNNLTCTTNDYRFGVNTPSCPTYGDIYYQFNQGASDPIEYSTDGGATWQTTNAYYGDLLLSLPYNSSYNICVRYCGQVLCSTGTVPVKVPPSLSLFPVNDRACSGNRSILAQTSETGTITMLSAPAGQSLVAPSTDPRSSTNYLFYNLIPGTYTIRFTNNCGQSVDKSITLTGYTLDYTYAYDCSGNLNLSVSETPYSLNASSSYQFKLVNSAGQVVDTENVQPGYGSASVPASKINSLPQGTYALRLYKDGLSCYIEKTIIIAPSRLDLSQSLFTSACGTTGTIVAIAQGGSGYQYALYLNSTSGIPIAGPQTGNIFNNLNSNDTYVVAVTDNCGRGTNYTTSFSNAKPQVFVSSQTQPCPGASFQLSVNNTPGATYQWLKDNTPIAGATSNVLNFSSIQNADAGTYKAQVSFGSCVVLTNSITLTPSTCGGPLPVSLTSFTAKAVNNQAVQLDWVTASEHTNDYFLLERSKDLQHFETVAKINAQEGQAFRGHSYSYIDETPYTGTSYYRLRQADFDGTTSTFPAISVILRRESYGLFPNPIGLDGSFTLRLDEPQTAIVTLNTIEGRAVSLVKTGSGEGTLSLKPGKKLSAGVYILAVEERAQTRQYRVVIDSTE